MSKKFTLADLGIDETALAVVPSGGESFGASVFVAPWDAFMALTFMTMTDYVLHNQDNDDPAPIPRIRVQRGDWYAHYYQNYEEALDAYEKLTDGEYKPQSVWVFYTDTVNIAADDETIKRLKDGFGEQIVLDLRVIAPRKGSEQYPAKNRHPYCMIALPSAVASIADIFGKEHAPWSVEELCTGEMTDEEFAEAFGDLDGQYERSEWWGKRAALWESLGESKPRQQVVMGSLSASGKLNTLCTTSEDLNECLMLTQGKWGNPIWCAITLVPDPRPDAVTEAGRRLSIPCITKIFTSPAEAKAWATKRAQDSGSGESVDHPALPANWKDTGVAELVKYLKGEGTAKPQPWPSDDAPPPVWQTFVDKEWMDSIELAKEWKNYIGDYSKADSEG